PAILVVGGSFAATQFLWSNYVDSNLVDIAAGVVSMICTLLFLRVWKPKRIWRFEDERDPVPAPKVSDAAPATPLVGDTMGDQWDIRQLQKQSAIHNYTAGQIAKAWLPFFVLSIFVLVWGLPKVKGAMNKATTPAFTVTLPDGKPRPDRKST